MTLDHYQNRKQRRAAKHTTGKPSLAVHVLPLNLSGLLPPEGQPEMEKHRRAIRDVIHDGHAGPVITALECVLGEVLASTQWAGANLDLQLIRSGLMVKECARAAATAGHRT